MSTKSELSSKSFFNKQQDLKTFFSLCSSPEHVYTQIMEWGKRLPAFTPGWKTPEKKVSGCQSLMYLHAWKEGNLIFFSACSDALISAGIAALLISLYSGETPETILKNPPSLFEELGITNSLSPTRANGLASLYLKMKQEALRLLLNK